MSYQIKKLRLATGFPAFANPETESLASVVLVGRPVQRDLVNPIRLKIAQRTTASCASKLVIYQLAIKQLVSYTN